MDDIQRRLIRIDKALARRRTGLSRKIISTAPLLFAAIGLITGIAIQHVFGLSIMLPLILLAICATAAIVCFVKQTGRVQIIAYLALVCFVCLGAVRLENFGRYKPNDIRNFVAEERKLATIRGVIVTDPYIDRRNWRFARFQPGDPGSSFYLKLNEVETITGWAKAAGVVRVQVSEPVLDLKAGNYIQAYCWLDRFKKPTNPGQFDIEKYLARKNVYVAGFVQSRDGIELLESGSSAIFTKVLTKVRETAAKGLLGDLSQDHASRGLLQALLLGYRADIDRRTYRAFAKTGLLHFISLSGLHLGILAGIIWWLCRTAGLGKRGRAAVCIFVIAVFLLIVPPRAPVLRAAIICFVFCISFFFRRYPNPLNTLSLAAIILLLIRPTQLFEAGWQLSFASVLGILLFTERIHFFMSETIMDNSFLRQRPKANPFFRIIAKPVSFSLNLFAVGLAAWLGGAGVLLHHFYTINPITSIWTVVTFPFVAGILSFGFLKMTLAPLLPTVAAALGLIATTLSNWLIWIVTRIADLNISEILIGKTGAEVIVFYYGLILFAGFGYFRRPIIKKVVCAVMISVLVIFLGTAKWQRTHQDNLTLTVLDVGHGQAILAQLPDKTSILFDAGSLHRSDIGTKIVVPFLNYSGINKIDQLVISHNDTDHINGIPEITEYCKVDRVCANNAFFKRKDKWGTAGFLRDNLEKQGFSIESLDRNLNIDSTAGIRTLWPIGQSNNEYQLSDNDQSQVLLIEFAGRRILLCSDIEAFAQNKIMQLYPDLRADVVVVPHHGSTKTSDAKFLESLEPDILIFSCGPRQYQNQQKIARQEKTFYTPRDGAIAIDIDKNGMIKTEAYTFKGDKKITALAKQGL